MDLVELFKSTDMPTMANFNEKLNKINNLFNDLSNDVDEKLDGKSDKTETPLISYGSFRGTGNNRGSSKSDAMEITLPFVPEIVFIVTYRSSDNAPTWSVFLPYNKEARWSGLSIVPKNYTMTYQAYSYSSETTIYFWISNLSYVNFDDSYTTNSWIAIGHRPSE